MVVMDVCGVADCLLVTLFLQALIGALKEFKGGLLVRNFSSRFFEDGGTWAHFQRLAFLLTGCVARPALHHPGVQRPVDLRWQPGAPLRRRLQRLQAAGAA